jgi:acetyl-CoA/propionyl-CoA carboxylase biotin carboxyl carrier protein
VSGIDLVREQFRIADGEELGYDDPPARGHSMEFRINGEDPGRNFLPGPGKVAVWRPPSGPGVRLDSGVEQGSVVGQAFDSLLAKLIVTGADRAQALQRARRALAEFEIDGLPTALPFHRAVVDDPAFAPADPSQPFRVHTRWIETEFDNQIPPFDAIVGVDAADERATITVEVGGKRLEVSLPGDLRPVGSKRGNPRSRSRTSRPSPSAHTGDTLTAPMQGTIVKVAVADGDLVAAGDLIVVLEAMKMEQPLVAHKSGVVSGLTASAGQVISGGDVVCEIRAAEEGA